MTHEDEIAFLQTIGWKYGDTTIHPPIPSECPDCRCQVRTCHRNESKLYKVQSAFSGKDIISIYSETSPQGGKMKVLEREEWNNRDTQHNNPSSSISVFNETHPKGKRMKIYEQNEWRNDGWDPLSYGRDFNFSRSFFEQFYELQMDVPRMGLISIGNENSGFTTGTGYCKNCYLINSSENCEDCYYSKLLQKCSDAIDCSYLYDSQLCYECFSVYDSYNCQYVSFSNNCTDCFFSSNLQSCKNCCLCTNLVNKEYHFLNEPLSKEEYEKRLSEFRGNTELTKKMLALYAEQMRKMTRKYSNIVNSQNCTGDYIENSKNCLDCYDVNASEDCRYVQVGVQVKDNYDCSNMYLKPELCYQTLGTIDVHNIGFSLFMFLCKNMLYCDYCFSCEDCFACTGLTRKQYCIFNKQYTKEEYEALVPKIIEHMEKTDEWGKFFPPEYAPFGYNETLAQEYYPLSKEEALDKGFLWRDEDPKDFRPQTTALPNTIDEAHDSITQEIFSCEDCAKNYRIIPQELAFYREHKIALPHKCPECRHQERMKLRNTRKLYSRTCQKCQKEIETTYAPEREEVVVCEECYLKEVY